MIQLCLSCFPVLQLLDIYRLVEGKFDPTLVLTGLMQGIFKFLHLSCVLLLNSWVRSSRTNHLEPILNDLKICTEESFPMSRILWRLVPPYHVPLYFFW